MQNPKFFVLLEAKTGMMDGVYKDELWAKGAKKRLSSRYPDEQWSLMATNDRIDIPDHLFHTIVRRKQQ